jgi:hypothetical protein
MECNKVFHTSLSVCSNEYLHNINYYVVVMETESFFCAMERIILIGSITYMDLVFKRLQTSFFQKKS